MPTQKPPRNKPRTAVRFGDLGPELAAFIRDQAARNERSVGAQIRFMLRQVMVQMEDPDAREQ